MAKCVACGRETKLHVMGQPVCVACAGKRDPGARSEDAMTELAETDSESASLPNSGPESCEAHPED